MWIVYVIQHSISNEIYVGATNNFKNRLERHNKGQATYTKRESGKWDLVYAEAYRDKQDAFERESKLKYHGSAKHELKKRIKRSLTPKVGLDK